MRRLGFLLALLFPSLALASAPPYEGTQLSTQTGTATHYISGTLCVAASSATAGTCTGTVNGNGFTGNVNSNQIQVTTTTSNAPLTIGSTVAPNKYIISISSQNSNQIFNVSGNGKVGISSAVPTELLDIGGNANVSGVYKVGTVGGTSLVCGNGQYPNQANIAGGIITSANCTSAGVGDVLQAGVNVFTSTNTIGPTAFNPIENDGPILQDGFTLVASTSLVTATSSTMTLTNSSGALYYIIWKSTQNAAAADYVIDVNGDMAANYSAGLITENSAAAGAVNTTTATGLLLNGLSNHVAATAQGTFTTMLRCSDGTGWTHLVGIDSAYTNANPEMASGAAWWRNVAVPTTLTFHVTAGTFTGKIYLYKAHLPSAIQ